MKDKFSGIFEVTKDFFKNYYKIIGEAAVLVALVAICSVTLVTRISETHQTTGIILSLSDVSTDKEAFAGNVCEAKGITYTDMVNVNYETEQLAQIEKTEKQVDEILAARSQNKKDRAAVAALTANRVAPVELNTYDPDFVGEPNVPQVTNTPDVINAGIPRPTEVTMADANGNYGYVGEFVLTGYCPCAKCCGAYSNPANPTTASGTTAVAGRTIAADTSRFPFGTRLVINGQVYTVEDVGSAIRGNHIDIFFNTHEEALAFGKQYGSVYLAQ